MNMFAQLREAWRGEVAAYRQRREHERQLVAEQYDAYDDEDRDLGAASPGRAGEWERTWPSM